MLYCLLIIGIAFWYLLIETNFLRIRLYVGAICQDGDCCAWKFKDEWVTPEMKQHLLNLWTNLPKEIRAKYQEGIQEPMCGWGYAYQYHDVIPECKVEMNLNNVRYKFDLKDPSILKDIMKANKLTKKQKVEMWARA
jgi:hypothetical protein